MISSAHAAHFIPPSESPAGAIALSVILAAVVGIFLAYMVVKRMRRRSARDGSEGDDGSYGL